MKYWKNSILDFCQAITANKHSYLYFYSNPNNGCDHYKL